MQSLKSLDLVLCKIARNSLIVFGLTTRVPEIDKKLRVQNSKFEPVFEPFSG